MHNVAFFVQNSNESPTTILLLAALENLGCLLSFGKDIIAKLTVWNCEIQTRLQSQTIEKLFRLQELTRAVTATVTLAARLNTHTHLCDYVCVLDEGATTHGSDISAMMTFVSDLNICSQTAQILCISVTRFQFRVIWLFSN